MRTFCNVAFPIIMKPRPAPPAIVAVSILFFSAFLSAQAQTGANIEESAVDSDITQSLLDEEAWASNELPGDWVNVSTNTARQSRQLSSLARVFGHVPQQVLVFLEDGEITRLDIIYLEAGGFFGYRKSTELSYEQTSANIRQAQQLTREVDRLRKSETAEMKQKGAQFKKLFADLEKDLPSKIADFTKSPGKRITVGLDNMLRSLVTEFTTPSLAIRLAAQKDQLVSVSIMPKEDATRRNITSTTGRRSTIKDNVKQLPDGDVVIENIPMFNQGQRGYCAIGTLAMITQYYGLNINIDQFAAKAGYKEGDVEKANINSLYESAAKEARLRLTTKNKFQFYAAMRTLSMGKPILVWRFFSRERDDFHTEFKARHQADPTQVLPHPYKGGYADKATWPVLANGGHASLVTGFNKARGEVLFTESWGEETRNRRMRAMEMEATCYFMCEFEP